MHSIRFLDLFLVIFLLLIISACQKEAESAKPPLQTDRFRHYVESFNQNDEEDIVNAIPNATSWQWLLDNVPFFECPDTSFEEIYYYRWWTYRKHIKQTPAGFVLTEFITQVGHSGEYNTISCALGHHIMEGRWLKNRQYLDDYILFWLRGNDSAPQAHFHKFSSWLADAVYQRYLVDYNKAFVIDLLPDLQADYGRWESEKQLENGLFWQYDVRDGMEESISGSRTEKNARPTINSYMIANAVAISKIARMAGQTDVNRSYHSRAVTLRKLLFENLWDKKAEFFKVRLEDGTLSDAREAIGFIPWYFKIPSYLHTAAWTQVIDTLGFKAPRGLTTAERRHPQFRSHGVGSCEWDGAVWPFATSQTLTAMAHFMRNYGQTILSTQDYFNALRTYARSHYKKGKPYIGEYHDEKSGEWLKGDNPRSRFYNHSTFADLVINGLVGLMPRDGNMVEVEPLLPPNSWPWFALDGVSYHGHQVSAFWDETGHRYNKGKGLFIYSDGKLIAHSPVLKRIGGKL
jgi:hypothetical protein